MKRLITAIAVCLLATTANARDWEKQINTIVGWNHVTTTTSTMDARDTADALQNQMSSCWQTTMIIAPVQATKTRLPDGSYRIFMMGTAVVFINGENITAYGGNDRWRGIAARDFPRWLAGDLSCRPVMGTKKRLGIE